MTISLVAAVAENGVIGRDNQLPWRLSSDLKRFKAETLGKAVVMGRRTFQSIGRPLPGRANVVVTRDRTFRAEGADVAHSLGDALALARVRGRCLAHPEEVCVIGGAELYALAMPAADRLVITHVLASPEGDALFPPIDPTQWRAGPATDFSAGPNDSHPTRLVVYDRR